MEKVTKKINELGEICIPVEMRRLLGIDKGEPVEISLKDGAVIIRKVTGQKDV